MKKRSVQQQYLLKLAMVTGSTTGNLGGPNAGGADAFISKYDASGTLQWNRQLGTSGRDLSHGVSADGLGSVYISGYTAGSLAGPNAGHYDAFISKYDAITANLPANEWLSVAFERVSFAPYFYESSGL